MSSRSWEGRLEVVWAFSLKPPDTSGPPAHYAGANAPYGASSIRTNRSFHRRAPHQPALVRRKIIACMGRAAIVPHQEIVDAPSVAIDEFSSLGMVEHGLEQFVALGLRHVDDLHAHEPINVDRLTAGLVVGAKHRMHRLGESLNGFAGVAPNCGDVI